MTAPTRSTKVQLTLSGRPGLACDGSEACHVPCERALMTSLGAWRGFISVFSRPQLSHSHATATSHLHAGPPASVTKTGPEYETSQSSFQDCQGQDRKLNTFFVRSASSQHPSSAGECQNVTQEDQKSGISNKLSTPAVLQPLPVHYRRTVHRQQRAVSNLIEAPNSLSPVPNRGEISYQSASHRSPRTK
ncbi:hypothetical protein BCR34DRAFT_35563 [Clohesyomyces aquaticus]|uniref:Uncharacterized protein n=1 Tax=Clohesyomyces aquaticus TaxID=1231657 RepID=A0A1Y1Z7M2_9PLEO|nr:hypothetical protein BCR34DRAFT_35563 [Clohesyomyces aquaticus]